MLAKSNPSPDSIEAEVTSNIHVAGLELALIFGTPDIPYLIVK